MRKNEGEKERHFPIYFHQQLWKYRISPIIKISIHHVLPVYAKGLVKGLGCERDTEFDIAFN